MPWDVWLIFLLLGVFVPWRGRLRLRELMAKPLVTGSERVSLYISTIVFQWGAVGVAGWRAWAHQYTIAELGLVTRNDLLLASLAILGSATLATLQWLNLRRMGRLPEKARGRLQTLAERILPQSTMERIPFFALAITAGVCEEFLYRGFAMAALGRAGLPLWGVVMLSSLLFGFAHLYQGRSGLLGTMILGLLFGSARVHLDSVIPVMVWHAAVDVVAGVAGPRYLVHPTDVTDSRDITK
jgi:uncharacterized protein